jgi:predicted AlkP superfamily phosphohydrolase/phosphomutase
MTFPVWAINGVMVAGAPTPDESRLFTYPDDLAERFADIEGEYDIGNRLLSLPVRQQIDTLEAQLDRTVMLTRQILSSDSFDAAMVVTHAPDNAHHAFWRFLNSADPERASLIDHFYERTDAFIGHLMEFVDDSTFSVVVSDHGGCPRGERIFFLDRWLSEQGMLMYRKGLGTSSAQSLVRAARRRLDRMPRLRGYLRRIMRKREGSRIARLRTDAMLVDWSRSVAFGVYLFHPYGGIAINLVGRQPHGSVPSERMEEMKATLRERLLAFVDSETGSCPVRAVLDRGEAFSGSDLESLPDLVLEFDPRYEVKVGAAPRILSDLPAPPNGDTSSLHGQHGIVILAGPMIREGHLLDGARIEDGVPTIMYGLGQPIPDDLDGRPLLEAFSDAFRERTDVASTRVEDAHPEGVGLSDEEEDSIRRHLADLGYVEE